MKWTVLFYLVKRFQGTFTDESGSVTITEEVAPRSKSYAFKMSGVITLKAKGVGLCAMKHHMTIEVCKQFLFFDNDDFNYDYSHTH